ncbi:hypothetical protein M3Y99_00677800 [Aphelenchoides fujianensis]|nr:hypothetical protein M3Y99_00677800 [Aphelenchoides fujianensis]
MRSSSITSFVLLALVGLPAAVAFPHHSNDVDDVFTDEPATLAPVQTFPTTLPTLPPFFYAFANILDTDQSTVAPTEASTDIPELDFPGDEDGPDRRFQHSDPAKKVVASSHGFNGVTPDISTGDEDLVVKVRGIPVDTTTPEQTNDETTTEPY